MCMREIGSMNYGMIYFRNRKIRKIFYSLRMLIKYIVHPIDSIYISKYLSIIYRRRIVSRRKEEEKASEIKCSSR